MTSEEIIHAIVKLNNRKAIGRELFYAEVLLTTVKKDGMVLNVLTYLSNKVYTMRKLPQDLAKFIHVLLQVYLRKRQIN